MSSHKEEALLSAACLQTPAATFLCVSSLPTCHADFILASLHNYVSQFCKWNLSLLWFFSYAAYGSSQFRDQLNHTVATYTTAVAMGSFHLLQGHHQSRNSINLFLLHTHTHTHTHTHNMQAINSTSLENLDWYTYQDF